MFERNVQYEAAYVGLDTGGSDEIMAGLRWIAARVEDLRGITVVAPTRSHFRDDEVLRRLPKGVQSETPQTLKTYSHAIALLACWPTETDLDRLDGLQGLELMCVIPWVEDEIATWRQARQAIDITGRTPILDPPKLEDPVVTTALQSLTRRVNLSTGLGHPMDRSAAIHAFRILKRGGHSWSPTAIKARAMANGWSARHATNLAEIAQGVLDGKRYRAGTDSWAADIPTQWQQRAINQRSDE